MKQHYNRSNIWLEFWSYWTERSQETAFSSYPWLGELKDEVVWGKEENGDLFLLQAHQVRDYFSVLKMGRCRKGYTVELQWLEH